MTEGRPGPERGVPPGSLVGRSIEEFVTQLRGFTDRARTVAGSVPAKLPFPTLPSPPGALSAAQLRAVAEMVAAQRASIGGMRAQLDAFDQQLAVFERILEPLVEWSGTWARLEEAVGDLVRRDPGVPGAEPPGTPPPATQPPATPPPGTQPPATPPPGAQPQSTQPQSTQPPGTDPAP